MFSLNSSFDYSSIGESDFRTFWKHPDCMIQISNGRDTRPIPPPSRKHSSKDVSNVKMRRKPSSSSKMCSNPSLISSSFSSKDDLTSFSPSDMIERDRSSPSSENYDVSASTSSLSVIKCRTSFPSTSDLNHLESIGIKSKDHYRPFNGEHAS